MTEKPDKKPTKPLPDLVGEIGVKATRKIKARRHGSNGVWFGLGMMGLIGWSVVVPTLLGTALGLWLDKNHPGGRNWTLPLLMGGLMLGCLNAWAWVSKEGNREDDDE